MPQQSKQGAPAPTPEAENQWRDFSADLPSCWPVVARFLGMKERSFWRAVHVDGLPCARLNARLYRFRKSEVEAWLLSRKVGAAK